MPFYTATEVALQSHLLDVDKANIELEEDFLRMLADQAGSLWTSLASLLSYTSAEVEEMLVNDNPAVSMLQGWRQTNHSTYGNLLSLLKAAFMLPSFYNRARHLRASHSTAASERHEIQLFTNIGNCRSVSLIGLPLRDTLLVIVVGSVHC